MYEYNLIIKALGEVERAIESKHLSKAKLSELKSSLSLSPFEYAKFQTVKSEFQAMGILSLESAMWIYQKLSNYEGCTLPERYVLYHIFASMLQQKAKL